VTGRAVLVRQVVLSVHDWRNLQSWSGRWSGPVLGSYHLEGVIWFLIERITLVWDVNCSHWVGGGGDSSRWFWFLVIKTLSVLSFLESKVIAK
jgi:hypothetical protein